MDNGKLKPRGSAQYRNSSNTGRSLVVRQLHQLKLLKKALIISNHFLKFSPMAGVYWLRNTLKTSFIIAVLLPWLVICVYLVFIKTPEYESSLNIFWGQKVKAGATGFSGFKAIFNKGKQIVASSESTSVLLTQKYINSANMLAALQNSLDIKRYYQSTHIDFLSRLQKNPNQQEFLAYYLKKVKVVSDPSTGELIISVKAFSAQKAQEILMVIAKNAMHYLNAMTKASLREQTKLSKSYLESSRNHLISTQLALNDLINQNKLNQVQGAEALALKRLDLKFAEAEYEAAEQAYVIWSLATHHNTPVVTVPESLPDYVVSPKLPNELISTLLFFIIFYLLGNMVMIVIREHID